MKSLLLAIVVFATTPAAVADILTLTPGPDRISGVPIAVSGLATVDGRIHELTLAGKGLRLKRVLLTNLSIYVAQVLTPTGVTIAGQAAPTALTALTAADAWAFSMHFVRDVDNASLTEAYREALIANDYEPDSAEARALLAATAALGDADDDRSISVVGERLGGEEVITIENTGNGVVQTIRLPESQGLLAMFLSLYFGRTPAGDQGLANLQAALLRG